MIAAGSAGSIGSIGSTVLGGVGLRSSSSSSSSCPGMQKALPLIGRTPAMHSRNSSSRSVTEAGGVPSKMAKRQGKCVSNINAEATVPSAAYPTKGSKVAFSEPKTTTVGRQLPQHGHGCFRHAIEVELDVPLPVRIASY